MEITVQSCPFRTEYLYALAEICPHGFISSCVQARPSPELEGVPSLGNHRRLLLGVNTLGASAQDGKGIRSIVDRAVALSETPSLHSCHRFVQRILAQEGELMGAVQSNKVRRQCTQ